MKAIQVIDSHTEGEPTRVVVSGAPEPAGSTIGERLQSFSRLFEDHYRALVLEPRAYEAVVGVWIGEPTEPSCLKDVIFFNPTGALGMCGHGTIGLMSTLAHIGIAPGTYRLNTPVGVVEAKLIDQNTVQVQNVPSYRIAKAVPIQVEGYGEVVGDVAWGGNTFFLVKNSPIAVQVENLDALTTFTRAVMRAVNAQGYPAVNHVEVFGPPTRPDAHSKNYILCPGGEYDRSPCGTGTSAKLACLAADGKLAPGEILIQESIIGTAYRAWYQGTGDQIIPTIEGRAYVTGESKLLFSDNDPMVGGILK
ncbi:MAG: proline racemase family protein [Chlorobia bacterium]|nr:proline racemase family protein [Fimbriimonadaceae bacterium]